MRGDLWALVIIWAGGICLGSFLGVLISRLPRGLPFLWGRSFCSRCKRRIPWFDNLPLVSFFLLGGKCRYCRNPISWREPLVELTTGVLTVAVWNSFSLRTPISNIQYPISSVVYWWILVWGLIVIFFVDLEHQIIPDEILVPLIILSLLFNGVSRFYFLILNLVPTAVVAAFLFLLLHLVTRGKGMGFGDVKLVFLVGLIFGCPKAIIALYLAFLTGAIAGIILILGRKAKLGQKIAFGPFLALSTWITIFLGDQFLWLATSFF
jgi:leader peptidase (prepilin peptidase)/N-methyltransferase